MKPVVFQWCAGGRIWSKFVIYFARHCVKWRRPWERGWWRVNTRRTLRMSIHFCALSATTLVLATAPAQQLSLISAVRVFLACIHLLNWSWPLRVSFPEEGPSRSHHGQKGAIFAYTFHWMKVPLFTILQLLQLVFLSHFHVVLLM